MTKLTMVGTCVVCEREIATRPDGAGAKLVHHGYRRPGDGVIHGDCFAVGMSPHELSASTADAWMKYCVHALSQDRFALTQLEANNVELLHRLERLPVPTTEYRPEPLYYGTPKRDPGWREEFVAYWRTETEPARQKVFADLRFGAIVQAKQRIDWSEREIARMEKAIETWEPRAIRERPPEPPKTKRRRRFRWVR